MNRLRLAHRLYDMGKFTEAGAAFEELTSLAESRRRPRAAQLLLQAGRTYARAGNSESGIELLVRGLRLMGERGQYRRLTAASARILRAVEGQDDGELSAKLKIAIKQLTDEYGLDLSPPSPTPTRSKLPSKCPPNAEEARILMKSNGTAINQRFVITVAAF
jgi:tetratricopeptide (TPR) repeat protein